MIERLTHWIFGCELPQTPYYRVHRCGICGEVWYCRWVGVDGWTWNRGGKSAD